jgi:F0F1-type ATP synthase membrane subunit c/vacuolar-type H+-ATPase subunit K
LRLFVRNFWLITKITFVIVAPFEIFRVLSTRNIRPDFQLSAGILVLDLLCNVLIAPALIYALMQLMQTGTAPGINESYRWGFGKLGKLIVCAVCVWIMVGLGTLLCFIPGIILAMCFMLVYPMAVLEKGSITATLWSSYDLTKGHRWNIFGATFIVGLLLITPSLPAKIAASSVVVDNPDFWPVQVAAMIFGDILGQAMTVLSLVIYLSIRALWSQTTQ